MFVSEVATDPVIVEPFNPNETPFELLNVIALRLLLVVPALKLTLVRLVATDAVIVEPFSPNEMPFEFENVIALRLLLVVPPLKLMLPWELATVAEAVTLVPSNPKEILFAFENVTAETLLLVVPAEMLMFDRSVPLYGRYTVALAVWEPARTSWPPEFDIPKVTVEAALLPTWNMGPRW
jgi:hypothetical protein